jgi:hypothetical protein
MLLFNVLLVSSYVWQHKLYAQPTKLLGTVGETAVDPGSSYFIRIQRFYDHCVFSRESQWHSGPTISVIGGTHYVLEILQPWHKLYLQLWWVIEL